MIQQGPAQYLAGTSINITNTFAYSGQMLSLLWRVQLPAGWTLKAVSGDGNPEKMGTEIIWTGSLAPSPIQMVYTVEIPANEAGNKDLRAEVEYQFAGMVNPAMRNADPNPLTLTTSGVIGPELVVEHAVSWPVAGAEGFILEVADDPAGPWVQVDTTPATDSTKNVVVIDSGAVKKFYRLRKP